MSGETSSTPTPLESGVGQTTGTRRLNQAQKEALDLSSHCVLTASAGSGKTTVLLNRVVEVLEKNGFIPEQVVAITFTEEAAAQIRHRVQEVILAKSQAVFHLIARAMKQLAWGRQSISTPGPDEFYRLAQSVQKDTDQLFVDMECENPYAAEYRERFIKEIARIHAELLAGTRR